MFGVVGVCNKWGSYSISITARQTGYEKNGNSMFDVWLVPFGKGMTLSCHSFVSTDEMDWSFFSIGISFGYLKNIITRKRPSKLSLSY